MLETMPETGQALTRAEFEALPDEVRADLVHGVLVVTPSATPWHQQLVQRLVFQLSDHLGRDGRSRILIDGPDVIVDEANVYRPDVMVLPEDTRATGRDWRIPTPIWIAEVLSPSTAGFDRGAKLDGYARAGVAELWLVDPETESITVVDLKAHTHHVFGGPRPSGGKTAHGSILVGFGLDLDGYFAAAGG